jgi:hypothetical protein
LKRRIVFRRRICRPSVAHAAAQKVKAGDIPSKLRWYKMGGGWSEKQWNDVLGAMAVQREDLDYEYLREWANDLEVSGELEKALEERHQEGWQGGEESVHQLRAYLSARNSTKREW